MAKTTTRDLTNGSPMRLILGFLLPMLFGLLFQQFYNMVDTIVVGKCLGVDALAGVGSTTSINFLVIGFCAGVCSGFSIPVAQKFGQRDFDALRKYVGNILWLTILLAVILTVVTCLLCAQILRWMNTSDDIFPYAYDYIFLIFLGLPATFLYNTLIGPDPRAGRLQDAAAVFAALLRSQHHSRHSLRDRVEDGRLRPRRCHGGVTGHFGSFVSFVCQKAL